MGENELQVGDLMEHGYGVVSKKLMKDPALSVEAKVAYAYISSYEGGSEKCHLEDLREDLGFPEKVFSKTMAELIGYLEEHGTYIVTDSNEVR